MKKHSCQWKPCMSILSCRLQVFHRWRNSYSFRDVPSLLQSFSCRLSLIPWMLFQNWPVFFTNPYMVFLFLKLMHMHLGVTALYLLLMGDLDKNAVMKKSALYLAGYPYVFMCLFVCLFIHSFLYLTIQRILPWWSTIISCGSPGLLMLPNTLAQSFFLKMSTSNVLTISDSTLFVLPTALRAHLIKCCQIFL